MNWITRAYMCQVEYIEEMDCSSYFDKSFERLLFILKNPPIFMSIVIKKMKRKNTSIIMNQKKKSNASSGMSNLKNSTVLPSSNFNEGDVVRIRSKEQIQQTLDKNNKLEGCLFMEDMWQYCGTEHKILKKVNYFYDEANFRMCKARSTVLLEGIHCSGKFQRYKTSCDRFCLLFWKEAWLEKI